MLPLCVLLLGVLFVVLWRWQDVLLAVASLAAAFAIWFAVMSLSGQQWNLASIAAIPLLLGTGIDYSIHMLLALQREEGDTARARSVTGRAVIFCALSTCAGFGSLLLATNGALSSLGAACATGLGVMMIVAVGFLPEWRRN
jgi:predicted RND superfamily exporter protein